MSVQKILIVDDEYSFAEYAKEVLELAGYQVTICIQSHQAHSVAQSLLPDLLLLDMNMPELNGIDVINQFRSSAATKGIPILMCSISKSTSDIHRAMSAGANDFLPKSLMHSELISRVNRLLKPI
jgi:DNA-binding response OmpR family regulator